MTDSAAALESLQGENYINLGTFKRNGDGVKTPVWFAHDGDHLVIFTNVNSWKVKRLRRDDRVRLAACGVRGAVHGTWFDGRCHRLEGADAQQAHRLLTRKYWVLMPIGNVAVAVTGRAKQRAYYRIDLDDA